MVRQGSLFSRYWSLLWTEDLWLPEIHIEALIPSVMVFEALIPSVMVFRDGVLEGN